MDRQCPLKGFEIDENAGQGVEVAHGRNLRDLWVIEQEEQFRMTAGCSLTPLQLHGNPALLLGLFVPS
jgi:hypothetical protein